MSISINLGNSGNRVNINLKTDECPVCLHNIAPEFIFSDNNQNNAGLEVVYRCTNLNCKSFFISYYKQDYGGSEYKFRYSKPKQFKAMDFSEEILEVSPEFIDIYNQSLEAENQNLDKIAGMGYRKALEFLIKDYCTSLVEEDRKNSILHKNLTQVIKEDLNNSKISQFAEKAVWIGNDETHYVRKWNNKDVEDLKLLISIVVDHIDLEIKGKKLLASFDQN